MLIAPGTLRAGTINVQGLITGSQTNVNKIGYLLRLPLDVLFLQETHISTPQLQLKFKQLFSQHFSVWNKHCGIIVKNASLLPSNPKSFLNDRVLSLSILWNSSPLSLFCVYAPASCSAEKLEFFEQCCSISPNGPEMLWAGDFNCWLNPLTDHIPNTTRPPHGHMEFGQFQSWYGLMDSALTYQDSYPPMTRHQYVGGQVSSSSRIDYIFLTSSLNYMVASSSVEIFPHSDHNLLTTFLSSGPASSSSHSWKKILPCNVSGWRFNKNFDSSIKSLNDDLSMDNWKLFKDKLLSSSCQSQSQRLFSTRAKIRNAQNVLNHLEQYRPRNRFSLSWSQKWNLAFSTLTRLLSSEGRVRQLQAGVSWSAHGEKCSKLFFSKAKARKAGARLDQVYSSQGTPTNISSEVSTSVCDFYSKLYTSSPLDPHNISNFVSSSGPPGLNSEVFLPITKDEVLLALKTSPRNKSPGPDGIPFEVYRKYSSRIAPILASLFNQCISSGSLLPGSTESFVITLFKKGDKLDLANWRPIALSNTDLKLFTKILANRLNNIGSSILSPNQYGFIQGRSIFDNINLVTNVFRNGNAEGAFCFLDQEKAYDRIDWDYLACCLAHYGIDSCFISWIKNFLSSSYLSVIGPSFKTAPIYPQRGLRQGDPMSPILYNFAINPLLTHLTTLSGISIPGQPAIKVLAFADDCVLGIRDLNDTFIATSCIQEFEKASQAKLNAQKSVALPLLNPPLTVPFDIKYSDEPIRHLGIMINSQGIMSSLMETTLLRKMTEHIAQWKYFQPSLKGKVLLFNTFVSSKIWYFVHCFPVSSAFCRQVKTLLNAWLWNSKVPPISSLFLTPKTSLGGLSLLDPEAHALKMFSKWISGVLDPTIQTPGWQLAARHQWTSAMGLPVTYPHALFSYLASHPNAQGPHSMQGFWRHVTSSFRKGHFKVTFSDTSFNCLQEIPSTSKDPLQPRIFNKTANIVPFDLKKLWSFCHTPFVPPKWNIHCWKVFHTVYRTDDRTNLQVACKYCGSSDTLLHQYFNCPSVVPVWNTLNFVFPSSLPTSGNQVNWFYQVSSCLADQDFRAIMFLTALWSIHTAFLETVNSSQPYLVLPFLRLSSNASLIFANIFLGSNWPLPIKSRILGWPSPWFLSIDRINRSVKFIPQAPPSLRLADQPPATDRPPDAPPAGFLPYS